MKQIIVSIILIFSTSVCVQSQTTEQASSTNTDEKALLSAYKALISKNEQFLEANHETIFGTNTKAFKARIDSLKNTETALVNSFQNSNKSIDPQLISGLYTETDYKHRRYQLLYPHNFHRYTGFEKKADVPSDYFENILADSFTKPDLLQSSAYERCINYYFDILSAKEYKFSHLERVPLKRLDNRYEAIVNLQANQEIKDFFLKEHFNANIWTYRVEAFDDTYKKALTDVKNEAYREEIKAAIKMGKDRRKEASEIRTYRVVEGIKLNAHIFYPENHTPSAQRPAHLFFHGGGWAIGLPEWSYGSCKKAAAAGRVAITFDYRLRNVHGTDIKASVSDALAAIAWVRENANTLGVNPNKVLVEGFSAGAHLALIAAMIEQPKDFGVLSKYSSKPNALILGSAPYDITGRDVYNVDYDPKIISPLYLEEGNLPPILAFHGEKDEMVEFSEFEKFKDKMLKSNIDFIFRTYPNAGHFYFRETTKTEAKEEKELISQFLLKNEFTTN